MNKELIETYLNELETLTNGVVDATPTIAGLRRELAPRRPKPPKPPKVPPTEEEIAKVADFLWRVRAPDFAQGNWNKGPEPQSYAKIARRTGLKPLVAAQAVWVLQERGEIRICGSGYQSVRVVNYMAMRRERFSFWQSEWQELCNVLWVWRQCQAVFDAKSIEQRTRATTWLTEFSNHRDFKANFSDAAKATFCRALVGAP